MKHFLWKIFIKLKNRTCTINTSHIGRNVRLSNNVHIGFGAIVAADSIGKYTYINDYCLIDRNVESIGAFCSIAYHTKLGLGSHPTNWVSSHAFAYAKKYGFVSQEIPFEKDPGKTIIGNDVWIGANATVLAGVKIGDGAIIGANSLVTKDVDPYSIVVGSPARHLRFRFPEETREKLLSIQWWNWDESKLKKNIHLFDDPKKIIASFEK